MTYLSVTNFWKYQNADVWKKSKVHPPWCKLWVQRDRELDALPVIARLLWFELLACATRNSNVLEADLNWIYAETRVPLDQIPEALAHLIKGGWLSETETTRRSRQPSRTSLDESSDLSRSRSRSRGSSLSKEDQAGALFVIRTRMANGSLTDRVELDAILREYRINGDTADGLRAELAA